MANRDYTIVHPDGRELVITGPDNATPEQLRAAAERAFGSAPAKSREHRIAEQAAADRELYDPAKGMSTFEKVAAGVGKAAVDTVRGAGQLIGKGLDAATTPQRSVSDLVTGKPGTTLSQRLGLPQDEDIAESRALDRALMDTTAGKVGNVAGHIATAVTPGVALKGAASGWAALNALRAGNTASQALRVAPGTASALEAAGNAILAPRSWQGATALGAATGAIQPATSWAERGTSAGVGALAGGGSYAALQGLARVVRPNALASEADLVSQGMKPEDAARAASHYENLRALMDAGITPTPGQALGGTFRRAEEALTSVPIVGDAIKRGQTRAFEDLNAAAVNRALAPVGETLPKGMSGRDALVHAENVLRERYDTLLPKLTTQADGQFITEINSLRNMVGNGAMDPAAKARFENILNNQMLVKFQGANATMTGQTLKQVESDLGNLSRQFRGSADPDQRLLGDAIRESQEILRRTAERGNPQFAEELRAINEGWANFKRVQRASSYVGAKEWVFTPAQLQSAVRATDRSKDKGSFARGSALMQDLAEPAEAVMGSRVPDSGTPLRAMTALGAGGAIGVISPSALLAALAGYPVYSRLGQSAALAALARRPDGAAEVAGAVRRLAPYSVVPGIAATTN